ncbi:uncharacterized protein AAGF69_016344 isoform 1-T1 [Amazona ochrocephala]
MRSKRCRELCWREGCSLKKDLQVYISCSFHVLSPNPSGYEQRQQHLDNANAKIQAWKCRKRKPEVFGSCSVPVHRHMQTHQQLLWGSGCCKQYAAQGKSSPKEERGLKRQKSLKGYPFIISLYKCSSNTG